MKQLRCTFYTSIYRKKILYNVTNTNFAWNIFFYHFYFTVLKKKYIYIIYSFHKYKNWISDQFNSKISRLYRYSTFESASHHKRQTIFPSLLFHLPFVRKYRSSPSCIDATFLPNCKLFENYHKFTSLVYSVSQRYSQRGNALLHERSTTYRFLVCCRLIKDEDEEPERCSFYVTVAFTIESQCRSIVSIITRWRTALFVAERYI